MKAFRRILVLAVVLATSVSPISAAESIQAIEQLPFDEAYGLWVHEQRAVVKNLPVFPSGITDPLTGIFTPTTFWVLTCRLGREAHLNESFLMTELVKNEWVCEVLETSPRLCKRYGVESQAAVQFDPKHGYKSVPRGGMTLGPTARRETWLNAAEKIGSQSSPANESQPKRPDSNTSKPTDASRR